MLTSAPGPATPRPPRPGTTPAQGHPRSSVRARLRAVPSAVPSAVLSAVTSAVTRVRPFGPGLAVAAVAVVLSALVNRYVPALSTAVVAVAAGAALANAAGVGERLRPGLAFVSRRVLRVAIALLGLQIAVPHVLALGWQTLAVVAVATGLTFALTPPIGRRLGLSPGTSLLIATGVSICGAAAIAAMRESTDLPDDEEAAGGALGVVVLYGTAAIALMPLLASLMGLTPAQLGVWTGAAVHEVAQVAAIGATSGTLAAAVTVKLGRVVLLAPIVALTSYRRRAAGSARPAARRGVAQRRDTAERGDEAGRGDAAGRKAGRRPPIVPLFVGAFLAMVAVRSTGLVPEAVTEAVPGVTNVLMAAALFGLGTGIDVRKLLRGGRAALLGGIATAIIAATSLAGVLLLV
ncbi:YeiH family protein [Nonomuraea candida]|uniref:YeiH family protein n=1 Tax=Nonomuraea candida TaxID=359159 RepID=UPI000A067264|nr:putative sulfate exporter family transporter [Nonomuraea candida]